MVGGEHVPTARSPAEQCWCDHARTHQRTTEAQVPVIVCFTGMEKGHLLSDFPLYLSVAICFVVLCQECPYPRARPCRRRFAGAVRGFFVPWEVCWYSRRFVGAIGEGVLVP
jgi:hypothetical protein